MKRAGFLFALMLVFGCFVFAMPAAGAPSGLVLMPTAEVLEKGEISLEAESVGSGTPWGKDCDSCVLLQFGLGSGIEAGIDRSIRGSAEYWYNIKWKINGESDSRPALAIGVQGINKHERSQPFAVFTKSLNDTCLHAGPIRIERKNRWMLGAEHPLTEKLAFQADYTSGDENMWSFGLAYDINEAFSLTVGRAIGNSSEVENGYVVNLSWSTSLR